MFLMVDNALFKDNVSYQIKLITGASLWMIELEGTVFIIATYKFKLFLS